MTCPSCSAVNPPKKWAKGRWLGEGGFGKVYKCHDYDNPESKLAVKLVEINPNRDPDTEKVLCTFILQ